MTSPSNVSEDLPYVLQKSSDEEPVYLAVFQLEMEDLEQKKQQLLNKAQRKALLCANNRDHLTKEALQAHAIQINAWLQEAEQISEKKVKMAEEMKEFYDSKIAQCDKYMESIERKREEELQKQAAYEKMKAEEEKKEEELKEQKRTKRGKKKSQRK